MVIEMRFHKTHPKIAFESSLGKSFRQKVPSLLGRERYRASMCGNLLIQTLAPMSLYLSCIYNFSAWGLDLALSRFFLAL